MTGRRATRVLLYLLGVAGIAWVDILAGPRVRLDPLYFGPVGLGAWQAGPVAGIVLATASAAARLTSAVVDGRLPGPIVAINVATQLLGSVAVALLAARVGTLLVAAREHARRDPLTGLFNARALRERLELELVRARREPRPVAVACIDLDRFKEVNDRWGHPTGDAALRSVASVLAASVRAGDTVARVGGDEFVVVLSGTDMRETGRILERVRAEIGAAMSSEGWPVTISVGAVVFCGPDAAGEEMIARADRALYRAKRKGRDAVEVEVVR